MIELAICPYCGAEAKDVHEEIQHMQERHPQIIEERLQAAGDIGWYSVERMRRDQCEDCVRLRAELARAESRIKCLIATIRYGK